jgi:hypothetical protein
MNSIYLKRKVGGIRWVLYDEEQDRVSKIFERKFFVDKGGGNLGDIQREFNQMTEVEKNQIYISYYALESMSWLPMIKEDLEAYFEKEK